MKNKTIKILSAIIIGTLCFGPTKAFASDDDLLKSQDDNYYISGEYIYDRDGFRYSSFVSASGEQISLEEAVLFLNGETECLNSNGFDKMVSDSCLQPFKLVGPDEGVSIEVIQRNYVGPEVRITPDVLGPATITKTVSTTVSASLTTSSSVSASVKELIFAEVKIECGVAVSMSEAVTDSYSVSFPVNSGKRGAIYFRPYCVKATGKVNYVTFTAVYPKTVNGYADGLFYLKER